MHKVSMRVIEKFSRLDKNLACPCCKSENIKYYTTKFGFDLDKCGSCDHIFTNPFPSNEALDYYYNSDFKKFENEFFLESFEKRVPIFSDRIELMKAAGVGKNVLDVGSAIGIFIEANKLANSPFNISSCDLSRDACEYLKKKYPDLTVLNEDVNDLTDYDFDCVTLWDTFEHIPNPKELLNSIRRIMTDDGVFIFSTPNTHSFEWTVMGDGHVQLLPPGHVNLYNVDNIKILLNNNGFEIEQIETMNPSLDFTYIKNIIQNLDESVCGRAALELFKIIFDDEFFTKAQKLLRDNRFAGNMLVMAKKI